MTHATQMAGADSTAVTELLLELANSDANYSDVHIEHDRPVMVRMPTGWQEVAEAPMLTKQDITDFLQATEPGWKAQIDDHAISRAIDLYSCRLRLNAFKTNGGKSLAINVRRQPLRPLALEETGLPMYLRTQVTHQRGLILVTGQTGAGKTTTMASLLDHVNQTRNAHIITIEDPIEFVQRTEQVDHLVQGSRNRHAVVCPRSAGLIAPEARCDHGR